MRSTILVLTIMLATVKTVSAEVVPYGCYVTDSERTWFADNTGFTVDCYAASDNFYSWTTPGTATRSQLFNAYGAFAEAVINAAYETGIGWQQCDSAYNNATGAYNQLAATYNSKLTLEKKLRRACGSKCKKIK